MIRNEREYRETVRQVNAQEVNLAKRRIELQAMGFSPAEVEYGIEALTSFHLDFVDEVQQYKRIKAKDLSEFRDLADLGRLLIAARIAAGLSQRELAKRLGVAESQVSRDEKHEYYGATLDRAQEILTALGLQVQIESLFVADEDRPRGF